MRKRHHSAAAAAAASARQPTRSAVASSASRSSVAAPSAPLSLLSLRACRSLPPGSVVSFLCMLVSADAPEQITRRDGSRVCVARWLVSDPSCSYLRLTLWGAHATDAARIMRVGQILLAQAFEVHSFRSVTSVESKSKSTLCVMDEGDTANAVDGTSLSTAPDRKKPRAAAGAAASLASASHSSDFRLASASLPTFAPASSPSNSHEICASAEALRQWARRADGPGMLGQPRSEHALSAPSMRAELFGSALQSPLRQHPASLSLTPLHSIPSFDANAIVSVSGQLRCVRRLPSTRGPALSSSAAAALSASASVSAASPPHSLFCVLSSRDESGFESLAELELRGAEWASRSRQSFWSAALGRIIVVQHARVMHSAQADAQSLQDTDETTITIAEATAAPSTAQAPFADASVLSPAAASPPELRGHLLAIRFPLLTAELHAQLRLHLHATVAAASSPSPLPSLPAALLSALFYTGCVSCLSPVSPDCNGVYECTTCFRSMRYSQQQSRVDGAAQVAFLYRDAFLTMQSTEGVAPALAPGQSALNVAASSSPAVQSQSELLASHSPLRDLMGNVDPQSLIDTARRSPQPPAEPSACVLPPSAVHTAQQPAAESIADRQKLTIDRLLRLQWCRLMLLLPIAAAKSVAELSDGVPVAAPLAVCVRLCVGGLDPVADSTSDASTVGLRMVRAAHVGRLDTWL